MSLATTLSSLESQLTRFFPHYVEVDRVELLPFATPGDVVAALRSSSSLKASERYALVAALVAEHQQRPHPLWTSILVLGFAPMMLRMRRGLGRVRDDDRRPARRLRLSSRPRRNQAGRLVRCRRPPACDQKSAHRGHRAEVGDRALRRGGPHSVRPLRPDGGGASDRRRLGSAPCAPDRGRTDRGAPPRPQASAKRTGSRLSPLLRLSTSTLNQGERQ